MVIGELIARFDDGGSVSELYRIRIPAGARDHQATHAPGLHKVMTVFVGEATVALADGTVELAAGQSAEWSADGPHTYSAAAAEDVQAALLVRYPEAPSGRWISSITKPSGSST
jgi:quercetin dioxygenase-like cupin family protein